MKTNLHQCKDCQLWMGLILFMTGFIFILQKISIIPSETWSFTWPILLIVIGVKLMVSGPCKLNKD